VNQISYGKTTRPKAGALAAAPRAMQQALPAEGDNGVFSESWFPVCLSKDVKAGQAIGRDFLGGRIVIYRGENGQPHVLSAYCAHLGADLSCGDVMGNNIRCAFHHWQFDGDGRCVHTAVGDPAPKAARMFRFPVRERWGIIFAFNGTEATWELPDFVYPDDEIYVTVETFPDIPCDPWVICCNTPDVQHIKVLHKIQLDETGPADITYTDHSMTYNFKGKHPNGDPVDWCVRIHGTSIYSQQGMFGDDWMGVVAPMGLPRPGCTQTYMAVATRITENTPEGRARAKEKAEYYRQFETRVLFEDAPILQRMRYRPGTLTKNDAQLARFYEYLRAFPRSHHSADFIS